MKSRDFLQQYQVTELGKDTYGLTNMLDYIKIVEELTAPTGKLLESVSEDSISYINDLHKKYSVSDVKLGKSYIPVMLMIVEKQQPILVGSKTQQKLLNISIEQNLTVYKFNNSKYPYTRLSNIMYTQLFMFDSFAKFNNFLSALHIKFNVQNNLTESTYSQQTRLDITHEVAIVMRHERIFFEAKLNKEADDMPDWIRKVSPGPLIAEATCELRNDDECYVGHIQAHQEGKGYASELLAYIIDFYMKKGIRKFSAYINHENANSKNLFRKAGFIEYNRKHSGSDWTMAK